jgi:hypothetical protein
MDERLRSVRDLARDWGVDISVNDEVKREVNDLRDIVLCEKVHNSKRVRDQGFTGRCCIISR